MDLNLVIGIIGATLVLVPFLMNQLNKWKNDSFLFDFLNFVGSGFLVVYGIVGEAYPFVVLNIIWALFSLKDLVRKN